MSSLILPEVAMEIPPGAGILDLRMLLAETRLIRPLVSFGLLEKRELPATEKEPFLGSFEVRKTPLFNRFLRFDFDDIPV